MKPTLAQEGVRVATLSVGTMLYDQNADLFARKRNDHSWSIYFPERHETADDEDIEAQNQVWRQVQ